MNEYKGEVSIPLNGQEYQLRFNMNTYRILLKRTGVKFSDVGEFATNEPMDFYSQIIYSALLNCNNYAGKETVETFEQVAAWVGDIFMDEKIIEKVSNAVTLSMGLGKQKVEPEKKDNH